MRVAHFTDVHWMHPPSAWKAVSSKRILGTFNLYLKGRKRHFDLRAQRQVVAHTLALKPDVVVITGDLTAQALPEEFDAARTDLLPLLQTIPTLIIPGNHDLYTRGARDDRRCQRVFGPWMGLDSGPVGRLDVGELTLLGLDPNRPTLFSSGIVPDEQLAALEALLNSGDLQDRTVGLAIHYPLVGPKGGLYENFGHGLLNVRELVKVLTNSRKRPAFVVHGHKHEGYRGEVPLDDGTTLPTFDPGSGGYAREPEHHRTAAMNIYTLANGAVTGVERYLFNGEGFELESGGAYSSGY